MRLSQAISQYWNNFSFRTKLSILLVFGIGCPMVAVTQGMIRVAQNQGLRDTQRTIAIELKILEEELRENQKRTSIESDLLAKIVSDQINNVEDLETTNWEPLLELSAKNDDQHSLQIIANRDGQSIAQKINIIDETLETSALTNSSQTVTDSEFKTVEISQPIDLKGIQIIDHVLQNGQSLTGIEFLSAESLTKLGLAEQANIGLRPANSNLKCNT
jgi:methyl-accepting chemotaxis protein PixJ